MKNYKFTKATLQARLPDGSIKEIPLNIDQAKLQQANDFETYSQLSPVEKRKMLRRITQEIPLKAMSYEQAKLYHRLKDRLK